MQISRQSDIMFAFYMYGSFCKFVKRQRRKRRNKKTRRNFKSHISRMFSAIPRNFGMRGTDNVGVSTVKLVLFHKGSTKLPMCENHVFFVPVDILYSRCGVLASWAARHTTVCLDYYYYYSFTVTGTTHVQQITLQP